MNKSINADKGHICRVIGWKSQNLLWVFWIDLKIRDLFVSIAREIHRSDGEQGLKSRSGQSDSPTGLGSRKYRLPWEQFLVCSPLCSKTALSHSLFKLPLRMSRRLQLSPPALAHTNKSAPVQNSWWKEMTMLTWIMKMLQGQTAADVLEVAEVEILERKYIICTGIEARI